MPVSIVPVPNRKLTFHGSLTIYQSSCAPSGSLEEAQNKRQFWNDRVLSALDQKLALEAEIEEAQAQVAKWEAIKEQRLAAQAWIDAEVKKILAKKEKEGKKDDE
ncbi:hypothetical protein ACHAPM_006157 [Fusarium culmorum]